jgi:hypothetical protein
MLVSTVVGAGGARAAACRRRGLATGATAVALHARHCSVRAEETTRLKEIGSVAIIHGGRGGRGGGGRTCSTEADAHEAGHHGAASDADAAKPAAEQEM